MDTHQANGRQPAEELALENEARIRLDLDGANVGLFEWNIVTNQSQWSTGFYRLHGLEPGGEASYELWRSQVHADDIIQFGSHEYRLSEVEHSPLETMSLGRLPLMSNMAEFRQIIANNRAGGWRKVKKSDVRTQNSAGL